MGEGGDAEIRCRARGSPGRLGQLPSAGIEVMPKWGGKEKNSVGRP